jgi:hypothetical protein
MDSKITGMTLKEGAPNRGGTRILAFFDCETPHLGMKGAALVVYKDGRWGIWPPKIEDGTGIAIHERRKCVYWRGDAFVKALLPAAQQLYWQLGGTDAEDQARVGPQRSIAGAA